MPRVTTTIGFTESANRKLRLFAEATKMDLADVVCDAIEDYIPRYLQKNEGVREKYEAEDARILESAGVSVLPKKRRRQASA
jgi:hypothetical protein